MSFVWHNKSNLLYLSHNSDVTRVPWAFVHVLVLLGIKENPKVPHLVPWSLTRYVKLRVAHAPGMSGTFSPPPRVSDPDMHHGTCVTHVPWYVPGSLTSGFLWSRWRGKRSRYSRRMRSPQFYVSGNRPIVRVSTDDCWVLSTKGVWYGKRFHVMRSLCHTEDLIRHICNLAAIYEYNTAKSYELLSNSSVWDKNITVIPYGWPAKSPVCW